MPCLDGRNARHFGVRGRLTNLRIGAAQGVAGLSGSRVVVDHGCPPAIDCQLLSWRRSGPTWRSRGPHREARDHHEPRGSKADLNRGPASPSAASKASAPLDSPNLGTCTWHRTPELVAERPLREDLERFRLCQPRRNPFRRRVQPVVPARERSLVVAAVVHVGQPRQPRARIQI